MAFKNDANWSGLFRVEIEGYVLGEFRGVKLPAINIEVIEYYSGQSKTARKRPGPVKYDPIVLRRGYANNDLLQQWWENIAMGQDDRRSLSIFIVDENGNDAYQWNCFQCWPSKWDLADFEAGSTEISVEEIEIQTERIERAK